jgi:hypothetical protein
LLKFSKGDWTAGEYNDVVPEGSEFIANMDEMLVGWVRWQDNKPTDHVMGKVSEGYQKPRREALGDNDQSLWEIDDRGEARDPWQTTNYLLLMGTGPKDNGQLYTFTTSSRGGINQLGELCMKYGKALRQHEEEYPIVKIGSGSYAHSNKNYGRIKFPTFEIVGWSQKEIFKDAAEGTDPVEEVTAPAPKARATAKPRF